ncbi:MAG: monooxygenase, partial [Actinomycetota bacterium]|nr:monooxygenase [Actinomycetota bacterium]
MTTGERLDVVVVGGGIAGSRWRPSWPGTAMKCWCWSARPATGTRSAARGSAAGAWAELLRLDLDKPLLDAGGTLYLL